MSRNCNLELNFFPSRSVPPTSRADTEEPQQEKRMTIFYNGRTCVWDLTELQARSIICSASAKMEEGKKNKYCPIEIPMSQTLLLPSPTGVSMKRSLQQFLEKRRHRIQATSPYHR